MKKSADGAFVSKKMLTFAVATIRLYQEFYKSQIPCMRMSGIFSTFAAAFIKI
jgi:hypothetical protein